MSATSSQQTELATFGGGCFWCLEACFEQLAGVLQVVSGYAGGNDDSPSYRDVCSGSTGHAEVIQLTFDPQRITFAELLEIFLVMHDPTTLNRQGADVGTQYRSIILTHSDEQLQTANRVLSEMTAAQVWPQPIVTQVLPLSKFYAAEDYHQGYFRHNAQQPYCQAVVSTKVAKIRQKFAAKVK